MRFNNRKLAALAMSAVMVASTMTAVTFAAEEDVVAMAESITIKNVAFDKDGNVTITYSDGRTGTDKATVDMQLAADCIRAGVVQYKYGNYTSEPFETAPALGHDSKEIEVVTKYPDCTNTGLARKDKQCVRCGATVEQGMSYEIAANGHKEGELQVRYTEKKNVNDKLELVDKTKNGSYTKETYYKCTVCGDEVVKEREAITVAAKEAEEAYRAVTKVSGIKEDSVYEGMLSTDIPADEKVLLVDCAKDGTYEVGAYDENDNLISTVKHTVKAHHVIELKFEKKVPGDNSLVEVYDKDRVQTGFKNVSCCKDANYYEISVCAACGKEMSKVEKTAKAEGEHVINETSKIAVETAKADAKANNGVLTKEGYVALETAAAAENSGIVITTPDACETEGTVTITYLCKVCGKETKETVTLKVAKLGHKEGTPVEENKVDATCGKAGSADAVVYCTRCNKELSRKTVKLPQLAHPVVKDGSDYGVKFTGNVVVDRDADIQKDFVYVDGEPIGKYGSAFSVTAKAVQTCEKCGTVRDADAADVKVKVVDVVKEDGKGNPGTITLNASYTVTVGDADAKKEVTVTSGDVSFNYFSNMVAYLERNKDQDLKGLVLDKDGVWRYYLDNEFQKDYVGIVDYNGGSFFVANGILCKDANGLQQNKDGKWYFLANGQIQKQKSGFAEYDGAWFYIKNGELDATVNGLVDYNGGTFLFAAGRLCKEVNGLWQDFDGTWYFLAQGQLQKQHRGVAMYDGEFFYIIDGKLAVDFNGPIEYNGASFNVRAGQLYEQI